MTTTIKQIENSNYYVSNTGVIITKQTSNEKELKSVKQKSGYYTVSLMIDNKAKTFYVHQLVAKAFIGDFSELNLELDHIDRDKSNNHVDNLQWISKKDNLRNRNVQGQIPLKGVYYNKNSKKYQTQIIIDGKIIYLGSYSTLEIGFDVYSKKYNEVYGYQPVN